MFGQFQLNYIASIGAEQLIYINRNAAYHSTDFTNKSNNYAKIQLEINNNNRNIASFYLKYAHHPNLKQFTKVINLNIHFGQLYEGNSYINFSYISFGVERSILLKTPWFTPTYSIELIQHTHKNATTYESKLQYPGHIIRKERKMRRTNFAINIGAKIHLNNSLLFQINGSYLIKRYDWVFHHRFFTVDASIGIKF